MYVLTFKIFSGVFERPGNGLGESLQALLVENQHVRKHVATRRRQQIDLLQTNQFVMIELLFGFFHLRLHVFEFVQLRISVRVQFLGNVFHPVQSGSVIRPSVFHAFHVASRVFHSSQTKRFDFLRREW